jgi:hypothetical protein
MIVRHPEQPKVVAKRYGDEWILPHVDLDDDAWLPNETATILSSLHTQTGIRAALLREIRGGSSSMCELEALSEPRESYCWIDRSEGHVPPDSAPHPLRAPWEKPGWFRRAESWAIEQLDALRIEVTALAQQIKGAWPYSCVFRLSTTAGDVYFKAVAQSQANEPALIPHLSKRWPANVPELLAADLSSRWMLMRDFGGVDLKQLDDTYHAAAVQLFAKLQIDSINDDWSTYGCEDRRLPRIARHMQELMSDSAALQPDREERLTDEEIARVRDISMEYQRLCEQLDSYALPGTLVQQDFRFNNVRVANDNRFIFYDWADSVVSHPFFSMTRYLNYVHPVERREPLIEAYLKPWASFASMDHLHDAFAIARRLNAMYQAVRFHIAMGRAEPNVGWEECVVGQLKDVLINEQNRTAAEQEQPRDPEL